MYMAINYLLSQIQPENGILQYFLSKRCLEDMKHHYKRNKNQNRYKLPKKLTHLLFSAELKIFKVHYVETYIKMYFYRTVAFTKN